jgi:glycosyltransferase involved in cell wall biosynthesis
VRVVCVPNWEFLHPGLEWLEEVDLMLCPARCTAELLEQWKSRFGFRWQVACLPWPVDTDRFRFRRRHVCRRFVFVNGAGGAPAFEADNSSIVFCRKGLDVLLAAARLAPEIPIIVYTCVREPAVPPNVQLRPPPAHNSLLYCDGDVCVQPSHWEGLGLPLLECQAAGMPLITTDFPPMREHRPWALIPATEEAAYLTPQLCIGAARIQPEDLACTLRTAYGRRIGAASKRARRFIERHHSWPVARPTLWRMIEQLVSSKN